MKAVGPLASFEGLLSMYGKNFSMFNDMIVAVEDLRNVEFSLVVVHDHASIKKGSSGKQVKIQNRVKILGDKMNLTVRLG